MKNAPFYFRFFFPSCLWVQVLSCPLRPQRSPTSGPTWAAAPCQLHRTQPSAGTLLSCPSRKHISEQWLRVFQCPSASVTIALPSVVEMPFQLACVKLPQLPPQFAPPVSNSSHCPALCFCIAPKNLSSFSKFGRQLGMWKQAVGGLWDGREKKLNSLKVVHCQKNSPLMTMFGVLLIWMYLSGKEKYKSGIFPAHGTIYNYSWWPWDVCWI